MTQHLAVALLPLELVLQVAVVAVGLLLVVGARRRAAGLARGVVAVLVTAAILDAALGALPAGLVVAALVVAAPVIAFVALNAVVAALFGRDVAGQVVGTWIVRATDRLFGLIPAAGWTRAGMLLALIVVLAAALFASASAHGRPDRAAPVGFEARVAPEP